MVFKVYYQYRDEPVRVADFHFKILADHFMVQKKAMGHDVYVKEGEPEPGRADKKSNRYGDNLNG
jgi:hypothetical protein